MKRDEKGRFVSDKKSETKEEKVYAVGFKGFGPGMVCRGKQYAENTVFEEPEAEICEKGMHFCENPLDVLEYYSLFDDKGNKNEFATIEALAQHKTDGNKSVTTKLRIGAKLSFAGFFKATFDFFFANKKNMSGDRSNALTSGDRSNALTSGDLSNALTSGDRSNALTSGYLSNAEVKGKESFAVATGINGKVKGALGCFLACAEWKQDSNGEWHPVAFVSGKVDGENLKADTWYTVKGGKFVEVDE